MNLEWSDSYNIGIPEIDVQHQRFLLLVKNLYKENDESKQTFLFEELYRYAVFHFTSEEELMRVYFFPDAEKQKEAHRDLLLDMSSIVNPGPGSNCDKEKFLYFLIKWFVNHTTLEDKVLCFRAYVVNFPNNPTGLVYWCRYRRQNLD